MHRPDAWSDETRVDTLKALWAEGKSASECLPILNGNGFDALPSLTRNAIIGKVHRLGIAHPGEKVKAPKKAERVSQDWGTLQNIRNALKVATEKRIASEPDPDAPVSKRKRLVELSDFECHAVTNDPPPRHGTHEYCGHAAYRVGSWGPYCEYHWSKLFREHVRADNPKPFVFKQCAMVGL